MAEYDPFSPTEEDKSSSPISEKDVAPAISENGPSLSATEQCHSVPTEEKSGSVPADMPLPHSACLTEVTQPRTDAQMGDSHPVVEKEENGLKVEEKQGVEGVLPCASHGSESMDVDVKGVEVSSLTSDTTVNVSAKAAIAVTSGEPSGQNSVCDARSETFVKDSISDPSTKSSDKESISDALTNSSVTESISDVCRKSSEKDSISNACAKSFDKDSISDASTKSSEKDSISVTCTNSDEKDTVKKFREKDSASDAYANSSEKDSTSDAYANSSEKDSISDGSVKPSERRFVRRFQSKYSIVNMESKDGEAAPVAESLENFAAFPYQAAGVPAPPPSCYPSQFMPGIMPAPFGGIPPPPPPPPPPSGVPPPPPGGFILPQSSMIPPPPPPEAPHAPNTTVFTNLSDIPTPASKPRNSTKKSGKTVLPHSIPIPAPKAVEPPKSTESSSQSSALAAASTSVQSKSSTGAGHAFGSSSISTRVSRFDKKAPFPLRAPVTLATDLKLQTTGRSVQVPPKKQTLSFATQKPDLKPGKISFSIKNRFKPITFPEEKKKPEEAVTEETQENSEKLNKLPTETVQTKPVADKEPLEKSEDLKVVETVSTSSVSNSVSEDFQIRKEKLQGKVKRREEANRSLHSPLNVPDAGVKENAEVTKTSSLYSPTAAQDSGDSPLKSKVLKPAVEQTELKNVEKKLTKAAATVPASSLQPDKRDALLKLVPKQAFKAKLSFLNDAFGSVEKKIQEELTVTEKHKEEKKPHKEKLEMASEEKEDKRHCEVSVDKSKSREENNVRDRSKSRDESKTAEKVRESRSRETSSGSRDKGKSRERRSESRENVRSRERSRKSRERRSRSGETRTRDDKSREKRSRSRDTTSRERSRESKWSRDRRSRSRDAKRSIDRSASRDKKTSSERRSRSKSRGKSRDEKGSRDAKSVSPSKLQHSKDNLTSPKYETGKRSSKHRTDSREKVETKSVSPCQTKASRTRQESSSSSSSSSDSDSSSSSSSGSDSDSSDSSVPEKGKLDTKITEKAAKKKPVVEADAQEKGQKTHLVKEKSKEKEKTEVKYQESNEKPLFLSHEAKIRAREKYLQQTKIKQSDSSELTHFSPEKSRGSLEKTQDSPGNFEELMDWSPLEQKSNKSEKVKESETTTLTEVVPSMVGKIDNVGAEKGEVASRHDPESEDLKSGKRLSKTNESFSVAKEELLPPKPIVEMPPVTVLRQRKKRFFSDVPPDEMLPPVAAMASQPHVLTPSPDKPLGVTVGKIADEPKVMVDQEANEIHSAEKKASLPQAKLSSDIDAEKQRKIEMKLDLERKLRETDEKLEQLRKKSNREVIAIEQKNVDASGNIEKELSLKSNDSLNTQEVSEGEKNDSAKNGKVSSTPDVSKEIVESREQIVEKQMSKLSEPFNANTQANGERKSKSVSPGRMKSEEKTSKSSSQDRVKSRAQRSGSRSPDAVRNRERKSGSMSPGRGKTKERKSSSRSPGRVKSHDRKSSSRSPDRSKNRDRRPSSRSPGRVKSRERRSGSRSPCRVKSHDRKSSSRSPDRSKNRDRRPSSRSPGRVKSRERRSGSRSPGRVKSRERRSGSRSPGRVKSRERRSGSKSPGRGRSRERESRYRSGASSRDRQRERSGRSCERDDSRRRRRSRSRSRDRYIRDRRSRSRDRRTRSRDRRSRSRDRRSRSRDRRSRSRQRRSRSRDRRSRSRDRRSRSRDRRSRSRDRRSRSRGRRSRSRERRRRSSDYHSRDRHYRDRDHDRRRRYRSPTPDRYHRRRSRDRDESRRSRDRTDSSRRKNSYDRDQEVSKSSAEKSRPDSSRPIDAIPLPIPVIPLPADECGTSHITTQSDLPPPHSANADFTLMSIPPPPQPPGCRPIDMSPALQPPGGAAVDIPPPPQPPGCGPVDIQHDSDIESVEMEDSMGNADDVTASCVNKGVKEEVVRKISLNFTKIAVLPQKKRGSVFGEEEEKRKLKPLPKTELSTKYCTSSQTHSSKLVKHESTLSKAFKPFGSIKQEVLEPKKEIGGDVSKDDVTPEVTQSHEEAKGIAIKAEIKSEPVDIKMEELPQPIPTIGGICPPFPSQESEVDKLNMNLESIVPPPPEEPPRAPALLSPVKTKAALKQGAMPAPKVVQDFISQPIPVLGSSNRGCGSFLSCADIPLPGADRTFDAQEPSSVAVPIQALPARKRWAFLDKGDGDTSESQDGAVPRLAMTPQSSFGFDTSRVVPSRPASSEVTKPRVRKSRFGPPLAHTNIQPIGEIETDPSQLFSLSKSPLNSGELSSQPRVVDPVSSQSEDNSIAAGESHSTNPIPIKPPLTNLIPIKTQEINMISNQSADTDRISIVSGDMEAEFSVPQNIEHHQGDNDVSQLDSSTVSSSSFASQLLSDSVMTSEKDVTLNDSQLESDLDTTLKQIQDDSFCEVTPVVDFESEAKLKDQDDSDMKAGKRGRRRASKKSAAICQSDTENQEGAGSEAPTRRRSTRIKNLQKEDDRDKSQPIPVAPQPREDKENKATKGRRGRKKKEEAFAEDSANIEASPSPQPQTGFITIKQVSDSKDDFILPDSVPRRGEEFNSPIPAFASPNAGSSPVPGNMKLKSRWRRWSELEGISDSAAEVTPPHGGSDMAPPPPVHQKSAPCPTVPAAPPATESVTTLPEPPPIKREAEIVERMETDLPEQKLESRCETEATVTIKPEPIQTPPPPPSDEPKTEAEQPPPPEPEVAKKPSQFTAPPAPTEMPRKPPQFEYIVDNIFLCERKKSKARKEAKRMVCDCTLPPLSERQRGSQPCGEDCLNRMLMIECGSRCPCGDYCTNKRFQRHNYGPVEPFFAGNKGWGIRATKDMEEGEFIIEYVGEVLDHTEFQRRAMSYDKNQHYYFMALNADEIVDATYKGNISRFTNHSCDPVAETQKWTVNGQLRIGFFTIKPVKAGDEITFDYQYENYGEEAQACYCGSANCRGYLGKARRSIEEEKDFSSEVSENEKEERRKKKKDKKRNRIFDDILLLEEIESMIELGGLRRREHVLELSRLMVRAESVEHRTCLLKVLQDTKEPNCLRLFLDYQGLQLLWSWMVDMPSDATHLKSQVLQTLQLLPINNRTILKESKILGMVTKWASQNVTVSSTETDRDAGKESDRDVTKDIAWDGSKEAGASRSKEALGEKEGLVDSHKEADTSSQGTAERESDASSQPTTPVPSKEMDSSKDDVTPLSIFNKKRRLLQSLQEEASGSDSDVSDISKVKGIAEVKVEDTETEMSVASSDDRCLDTSQDGSELGQVDLVKELGHNKVNDLAADLLKAWKDLKEQFKIPKIKVEERKKREREMELKENERGYKDARERRGLGWQARSSRDRKRHAESPERRGSEEKKRRQSETDERLRDRERFNKVLTPTPPKGPKMSKEEHRKLFELQVKAEDQMRKQQEQEIQEQQLFGDPAAYAAYYTQPQVDDPNYVAYSQDPGAGYAADGSQAGMPMVLQPSSQVVMDTSQQNMYPASTQYVDPGNPQVVYQTSSYQQQQQQYPSQTQSSVTYVQSQPVQLQQVYYQTPQGQVIVQQPVVQQTATQLVQQVPAQTSQVIHVAQEQSALHQIAQLPPLPTVAMAPEPKEDPPPPPSPPPPKKKSVRLPPNWKTAKDGDGKTYYYHTVTRQTQWDPPQWESASPEDEGYAVTPIHDEPTKSKKKKEQTSTASADSSSETAKKIKDAFRSKISKYMVKYLGPFRRGDCKLGRITTDEDFKHLARKLTHAVLDKELKYCRHVEDLEVNESVKGKAKDFVRKYMQRFGPVYKSRGDDSPA